MKYNLPKYNLERKRKVINHTVLRGVICAYLLHLDWMIIQDPAASGILPILLGGLFALIAVGFGIYTWKRYQSDLKVAELTPEELEQETALAEEWDLIDEIDEENNDFD